MLKEARIMVDWLIVSEAKSDFNIEIRLCEVDFKQSENSYVSKVYVALNKGAIRSKR